MILQSVLGMNIIYQKSVDWSLQQFAQNFDALWLLPFKLGQKPVKDFDYLALTDWKSKMGQSSRVLLVDDFFHYFLTRKQFYLKYEEELFELFSGAYRLLWLTYFPKRVQKTLLKWSQSTPSLFPASQQGLKITQFTWLQAHNGPIIRKDLGHGRGQLIIKKPLDALTWWQHVFCFNFFFPQLEVFSFNNYYDPLAWKALLRGII